MQEFVKKKVEKTNKNINKKFTNLTFKKYLYVKVIVINLDYRF